MSDQLVELSLQADRLNRETADLKQLADGIKAVVEIVGTYPSAAATEREELLARLDATEIAFAAALDMIGDPFCPARPSDPGRRVWPRLGVSITAAWSASEAAPDWFRRTLELAPDWIYQVRCLEARIARRVESLRRQDATVRQRLKPHLTPKKSPNDARDKWMYEARRKGKAYKWIIDQLKLRPKWEYIDSGAGICMAIQRYCNRKGLEQPTSR